MTTAGADMTAFLRAGATRPTTFAIEIADLAADGRTSATRRGGVGHDHVARSVPRLGSRPDDSPVRRGADARPLPRGRLTQAAPDDVRPVQHPNRTPHRQLAPRHGPGAAPPRRPPVVHGVGAAETGLVAGEPDGEGTLACTSPSRWMALYRAEDPTKPLPGPAQLIAARARVRSRPAGHTLHAPDSTRGVVRMNHETGLTRSHLSLRTAVTGVLYLYQPCRTGDMSPKAATEEILPFFRCRTVRNGIRNFRPSKVV